MRLIVTLEPYARKVNMSRVVEDLNLLGLDIEIDRDLSREGELIINVNSFNNIEEISRYLRNIEYICHIIELKQVLDRDSLESTLRDLVDSCGKILEEHLGPSMKFKIICKRVDKKFPLTSVEVCKTVGNMLEKLGYNVDLYNPDLYIYVEIREKVILVGWSPRHVYHKQREIVPMSIVRNVVAIVLEPLTIYEYMDLLQLSRALGIELWIIDIRGRSRRMIEDACRKLKISVPENVKVVKMNDLKAMNDVVLIVLSQYSSRGETYLRDICRELLSRRHRVGLVVGNEIDDVPLELRDNAICEVRLGTMTGQAMRSATAIAYALGVIFNMFTIRENV